MVASRPAALLAFLCLAWPSAAAAQSPRAASLGGAFWTAGGEGHAIFHHPALISGGGFAMSLGGKGRRGDVRDIVLSASGAWFGGTAAAGLTVLPGGHVASLGFARELFGLDAGVAAKLTDGDKGDHGVLVDFGVARGLGPVTAALTVQNLGRHARDRGDAGCDKHSRRCWTDSRVVLGAGTARRPVGPLDVGAAFQVAVEGDGAVTPGGGIELAWWPIQRRVFIARVGLTRAPDGESPLTFGAGFAGDRIRIDYGYGDLGDGLAPHRIGVAIR